MALGHCGGDGVDLHHRRVHLRVLQRGGADPVHRAAGPDERGHHRVDLLLVVGLPAVAGDVGPVVGADDEHHDLGVDAGELGGGLGRPVEEARVGQPARHARVEVGLHDAGRAGDRPERRAERSGERVAPDPESERIAWTRARQRLAVVLVTAADVEGVSAPPVCTAPASEGLWLLPTRTRSVANAANVANAASDAKTTTIRRSRRRLRRPRRSRRSGSASARGAGSAMEGVEGRHRPSGTGETTMLTGGTRRERFSVATGHDGLEPPCPPCRAVPGHPGVIRRRPPVGRSACGTGRCTGHRHAAGRRGGRSR